MSTKKTGCLWIIMGGILALSLLFNLALVATRKGGPGASGRAVPGLTKKPRPEFVFQERTVVDGEGSDRIALIRLNGLISTSIRGRGEGSMVDDLKAQLEQAAEDDGIKAIVLAIDSPGGEVTASDILYNAVKRAREKKPVVVSMGSLAASGGYYTACGGSWIIANETTFTGSIGVIIQTFRYNDLLNKVGVVPVTFKSGAFKDMLGGTRELTPEEKEYVQKIVMETYGKFVGIVAKERHLSEEALRNGVADGRIITGKDAFAEKLVDQLGEVEAAYEKARELGKAPGATVITYEEPFRLGQLFRFFGSESQAPSVQINVPSPFGAIPVLEPGRAYFLPSICVP